jgi:cytochrome b
MIGAGIHITGVLVMQKLTGTPLIKTMITGKR